MAGQVTPLYSLSPAVGGQVGLTQPWAESITGHSDWTAVSESITTPLPVTKWYSKSIVSKSLKFVSWNVIYIVYCILVYKICKDYVNDINSIHALPVTYSIL